ncbi:hypothetical protein BPOR_0530g00040 [Botrytis porri]|uniref:Peptidase M20 dimerisation domain-containing protein n=1 Tax=Botrytis porri TaxID=87229 RepID=A0A4Z1KFG2_9HELO|nr:hypothetical protein BPOR_0530g00040 [Botrytis porri]
MSEAAQVAAQKTIYCPELAPFEKIYRDIHRNPELSLQEVHTATLVVEFLESLGGYQVIKEIGGHGVVEILNKRIGSYSSSSRRYGCFASFGEHKFRMHTAVLLADAKMLLDAKSEWSGTLIVLFQPAEELAVGARATIEDGLYDPSKFAVTKPDIVLGLKTHAFKAGMIALGGADPFGASEYFSYLALGCDAPYVFYNFGYVDEDTWEEAKTKGTMEDIPHNHSAIFAPKIQPTTTITVIPAHLRV